MILPVMQFMQIPISTALVEILPVVLTMVWDPVPVQELVISRFILEMILLTISVIRILQTHSMPIRFKGSIKWHNKAEAVE